MMITSSAQAMQCVKSVLTAMDQLCVQGRHNCLIVTGISGDLMKVLRYLSDAAAKEEKEKEKKKSADSEETALEDSPETE